MSYTIQATWKNSGNVEPAVITLLTPKAFGEDSTVVIKVGAGRYTYHASSIAEFVFEGKSSILYLDFGLGLFIKTNDLHTALVMGI